MKPTWPIWSSLKPLRSSYPDTSLLGGMKYTDSASTDIRIVIQRERERIERERRQQVRK